MLVTVFGRVTEDFALQTSVNKNPYVRFDLRERVGYGKNAHNQYTQVWAFRNHAEELVRSRVRSGSLIWVTGTLELEEFIKRDGVTKDKRLKIKMTAWGFVPVGKAKNGDVQSHRETPPASGIMPEDLPLPNEIDGDRDNLPG